MVCQFFVEMLPMKENVQVLATFVSKTKWNEIIEWTCHY